MNSIKKTVKPFIDETYSPKKVESKPKNLFADTIKVAREKLGLSQTEVAKRLNTSVTRIWYMENCPINTSLDMVEVLANLYNLNLETLAEYNFLNNKVYKAHLKYIESIKNGK